jgi:pyruvate-ferredoxin/flavodoxin oxidoreductase
MQGVALVGVFLRLAPFVERAGFDRERLFESLGSVLRRYFGKRGGAVVDANLEVIREAYDSLIDVTSAIRADSTAHQEVLA